MEGANNSLLKSMYTADYSNLSAALKKAKEKDNKASFKCDLFKLMWEEHHESFKKIVMHYFNLSGSADLPSEVVDDFSDFMAEFVKFGDYLHEQYIQAESEYESAHTELTDLYWQLRYGSKV